MLAIVAALNHRDETPGFVEPRGILLDNWPIDGEFHPCTPPDTVQLVCAVAYGDDF